MQLCRRLSGSSENRTFEKCRSIGRDEEEIQTGANEIRQGSLRMISPNLLWELGFHYCRLLGTRAWGSRERRIFTDLPWVRNKVQNGGRDFLMGDVFVEDFTNWLVYESGFTTSYSIQLSLNTTMDLLGSILKSMDAPPTTEVDRKAKGEESLFWIFINFH